MRALEAGWSLVVAVWSQAYCEIAIVACVVPGWMSSIVAVMVQRVSSGGDWTMTGRAAMSPRVKANRAQWA